MGSLHFSGGQDDSLEVGDNFERCNQAALLASFSSHSCADSSWNCMTGAMAYGWSKFCAIHRLGDGYKVILSCEQKWIFNTIILDENDNEDRYDWSEGQNRYWRELHLPQDKEK